MSLTDFLVYLRDKGVRSYLEERVFQALNDEEFRRDYAELSFLIQEPHAESVVRNVGNYDNPSDPNAYSYFQLLLVNIVNAHAAYLYDKKGKFSNLKKSISDIENRITEANKDIENLKSVSSLISGEEVLQVYAKEFSERAKEYKDDADEWQEKLYIGFSILGLITACLFLFNVINVDILKKYLAEDIRYFGYLATIFVKVVVLIGIIQAIRFFYRNYNASKHLENQTRHKSDVLRALVGIYKTIDPENKAARDELIKTGALTAFQNIESGYITTKEGAGNADAGLYAVINGVLRK